MEGITRRSCLKIASLATLPTITGNAAGFTQRAASTDYVESIRILDAVPHFPHCDAGNIVSSNSKFMYVEIKDDLDPDPTNSWVETVKGKRGPVSYPRVLWINDSIRHTIWSELVDGTPVTYVDHGLLFEVPPGNSDVTLYIDGVKQQIPDTNRSRISRAKPNFNVQNIRSRNNGDRVNIEIDVQNRSNFDAQFVACVNVTQPIYYTRFLTETVSNQATITGEVYTEATRTDKEPRVDIVTPNSNSKSQ